MFRTFLSHDAIAYGVFRCFFYFRDRSRCFVNNGSKTYLSVFRRSTEPLKKSFLFRAFAEFRFNLAPFDLAVCPLIILPIIICVLTSPERVFLTGSKGNPHQSPKKVTWPRIIRIIWIVVAVNLRTQNHLKPCLSAWRLSATKILKCRIWPDLRKGIFVLVFTSFAILCSEPSLTTPPSHLLALLSH